MSALTMPPSRIGVDPYRTSGSASFEETVAPTVEMVTASPDYLRLGSPPVFLAEFGCTTAAGDASVAAYMTGLRTGMANQGLIGGCFFNRNTGGNFKIDGGALPKSVAAFTEALAA
jgi:hypothetical protein